MHKELHILREFYAIKLPLIVKTETEQHTLGEIGNKITRVILAR